MKKLAVLAVVGTTLAGCSQYAAPPDRIVRAAIIGGVAGGVIGGVATGSVGGLVVGAGIGAAAGAAIASATPASP
ncbi:MAG: hypothetical protein WD036_11765 [Bauldia sp.]